MFTANNPIRESCPDLGRRGCLLNSSESHPQMPSSPTSIRIYQPEDLDAAIDIFRSAILQIASANYTDAQTWAQVDRRKWPEGRLSRPTWLAEVNGLAAGFTDLEPDGHLDMMYVHPKFARSGVATALLGAAEEHAKYLGLARIYSEVSLTETRRLKSGQDRQQRDFR